MLAYFVADINHLVNPEIGHLLYKDRLQFNLWRRNACMLKIAQNMIIPAVALLYAVLFGTFKFVIVSKFGKFVVFAV